MAEVDRGGSELPPLTGAMELLWAPPERGRRGPRPALSLELIVQTAVAIADRDGLAAVSMAKLAADLGFTTMSLYRHVPSKDDLVLLMVNEAAGQPPAHPEATGWRHALELWNADQIALLMRHPWRTLVPITGPPLTPNELSWLDAALATMRDIPLTEQEKFASVQTLATIGLGQVRLVMEIKEAAATGSRDEAPFAARLAAVITAERYPAIHRSMLGADFGDDTVPPDPADDPDFQFGVQRFLDGIASLIATREAG